MDRPSESQQRLRAVNGVAKISRSPFLNLVRANRLRTEYRSMREAIRDSAAQWRTMTPAQKLPYQLEARSVARNTHVPAYYRLGEHVLGKRIRGQLNLFKAKLEHYLDAKMADSCVKKESDVRK